jgi:hypothetical protein
MALEMYDNFIHASGRASLGLDWLTGSLLIGSCFQGLSMVEIIPGRYAVCFLKHSDGSSFSALASSGISYCIDDELVR